MSAMPQTPVPAIGKQIASSSLEKRPSSGQRWGSLVEFAIGSAIVIGHYVYHVVPNEVPILAVLCLISFRLRDGSWTAMGLLCPKSWRLMVLIALCGPGTGARYISCFV